MKYLVIYSHPNPKSFNNAILKTLTESLEEKGDEVRVRDLYAMNFDPVLKASDFELMQQGEVAEDVKVEQDHVRWADTIVFVFPLWWASTPAIARGYLDRVFSEGFAYRGIEGLLGNKKAYFFCTMGAPEEIYEKTGMFKSMDKTIDDTIFKFCGMNFLGRKYFGSVPTSTDEERKAMLEEVKRIAKEFE